MDGRSHQGEGAPGQHLDPRLHALFASLEALPGIGPALAGKIAKVAGGGRVLDLLFHLPDSYVDRSHLPTLAAARAGQVATLLVDVVSVEDAPPPRPCRVLVRDASGLGELAYFGRRPHPLCRPGAQLAVSGRIERFSGRPQMRNPDRVEPLGRAADLLGLEPTWPLTAGLFGGQIRRAMQAALLRLPSLPEWHSPALLRREHWPGFTEALRNLQAPSILPGPEPRRRLAYDELLAHQLAMAWARRHRTRRPGSAVMGDGTLRAEALRRFGHAPTPEQSAALAEIDADLAAPRRMLRLLQGDVGSGKTFVALLAMLRVAEAGRQAALMAPTEVLAKQHHRVISGLSPVPTALLTGSLAPSERRVTLAGIAGGYFKLVVGTHALFQAAVRYQDLALAVVDEQHRFGVEQRRLLGEKGERTDLLVMTATPIPRTLLLTQWGEMAVSRLAAKPGGRRPIQTTIHSLSTLPDVIGGVGRALGAGDQVYWICPLVGESEAVDLAAAEARFADLRGHFGALVGLVHGRQEAGQRDATLAAFAAGEIRLLVATTVVEVGVDVPQATVMVVEHAERFGLAQLHQLRGRVGRGSEQSFCLLLHDDGLTDTMRRRLTLVRDTEDGFRIADEDFRLRGGGEILGKRQSGLPAYRFVDPEQDQDLLEIAARDAVYRLDRDPKLEAVRLLLQIFERHDAVQSLAAG